MRNPNFPPSLVSIIIIVGVFLWVEALAALVAKPTASPSPVATTLPPAPGSGFSPSVLWSFNFSKTDNLHYAVLNTSKNSNYSSVSTEKGGGATIFALNQVLIVGNNASGHEDNFYSSAIVALDGATGAHVWTTHVGGGGGNGGAVGHISVCGYTELVYVTFSQWTNRSANVTVGPRVNAYTIRDGVQAWSYEGVEDSYYRSYSPVQTVSTSKTTTTNKYGQEEGSGDRESFLAVVALSANLVVLNATTGELSASVWRPPNGDNFQHSVMGFLAAAAYEDEGKKEKNKNTTTGGGDTVVVSVYLSVGIGPGIGINAQRSHSHYMKISILTDTNRSSHHHNDFQHKIQTQWISQGFRASLSRGMMYPPMLTSPNFTSSVGLTYPGSSDPSSIDDEEVLSSSSLLIGCADSLLFALDTKTGSMLWNETIGASQGLSYIPGASEILVTGYTSYSGRDPHTGNRTWKHEFSSGGWPPVLAGITEPNPAVFDLFSNWAYFTSTNWYQQHPGRRGDIQFDSVLCRIRVGSGEDLGCTNEPFTIAGGNDFGENGVSPKLLRAGAKSQPIVLSMNTTHILAYDAGI